MDRQTDDFAAFVADCEQQLRGTALLLTGDPAQADDLVVAALARTHRRWRRLASPADALADTRRTLVAGALGHTRLSASGGSIGTLTGPDDGRPTDEQLDPGDRRWLAALAGLGPTARAVVVLRLVEGQDEESVAELLGREPRVVAESLESSLDVLAELLEAEPAPPVAAPVVSTPWPGTQPDAQPDGDPDAAFRRPGSSAPPAPTAPAPAPVTTPAATPAADDDPWAIYRRPA